MKSTMLKLALAATVLWSTAAAAQETRLFLTSLSPAGSRNSVWFNDWASRVNAASQGSLKIEVRDGTTLANFANTYQRVIDDVVQIGWAPHPLVAGKFPLTEVAGLPFLSDESEKAATAIWRLYKTGLLDAEYNEVVPIWMGIFPQSQVHFSKQPRSIDDLRGLKISSSSRIQAQLTERLGASAISIQTGDVYEALQRGTIDGAMLSYAAFIPYKLHEVSSYHLEAPIGAWTFMFFMSKAKWNALPPAARKALEDNGGERQSRAMGKFFDGEFAIARGNVQKMDKHAIVQLAPAQVAAWRKAAEPVVEEWKKSRPGGEAVANRLIDTYSKLLADVKAGK